MAKRRGVYRVYTPKKFRAEAQDIIRKARTICDDYADQGYDLTLRQIYYQFVARGWIANRQTEYKRLGSILNDARLAGELDWTSMVDRTRNLMSLPHFNDPGDFIHRMVNRFNHDLWKNQPTRVEVWVEKDALVGILASVCPNEDVAYFSCRGYTSQTEIWGAAQRVGKYMAAGQDVVILHLGDHDPSGMDMTRDIEDRMRLFLHKDETQAHIAWAKNEIEEGRFRYYEENASEEWKAEWRDDYRKLIAPREWAGFEVRRIALNWDQIEQYNPPPNPAKQTDARWQQYVAETGLTESWELDALEPNVLATLIRDEIESERDGVLWAEAVEAEEAHQALLKQVAERWDDVVAFLNGEGEAA